MKLVLASAFLVTALLYASAGFGGGSTYIALLSLSGTDYRLIPLIALCCNILVVSANVWRYGRGGLVKLRRIWPFIVLSVPFAWAGASLPVSETLFTALLMIALAFSGLRLLCAQERTPKNARAYDTKDLPLAVSLFTGAAIGFYSGLVGIGGGIFLAPILYVLRWGAPKHIAAASSVFILVNSGAGIIGQFSKLDDMALLSQALTYWPVLPAVMIGGYIGNRLTLLSLTDIWIKRLTGVLILGVALRLGWQFIVQLIS